LVPDEEDDVDPDDEDDDDEEEVLPSVDVSSDLHATLSERIERKTAARLRESVRLAMVVVRSKRARRIGA
jgi:hypothetical protein